VIKRIPDLHYRVVRGLRPAFTRVGYACVFYRHDKDGKQFIDDCMTFYGDDGRKVRSEACRFGRDVIERRLPRGLRTPYVPVDFRRAVRSAGLNPEYVAS